jgi:hypothetical protein
MKRVLTIVAIALLIIVISIAAYTYSINEKRPEATSGPEAEALAQKIYSAVNKQAWDSLEFIQWTFSGRNNYTWDKQRNLVEVEWKNHRVLLNPSNQTGLASLNGKQLSKVESTEWVEKAYSMFCNDGFWMNAFTKLHDPGTERGLHITEEGDSTLLVTYTTGGVTPGDAYLWKTNADGLPISYKMWVSIIPIGGLEFTWEDWDTLYNGALIARNHKSELLDVPITQIKSGANLEALGKDSNLFEPIIK